MGDILFFYGVLLVGLVAAFFELEYIVFHCSKDTPLLLRIASALQAVGAVMLVFSPLLCGALLVAGLAISSSYNYSRRAQ